MTHSSHYIAGIIVLLALSFLKPLMAQNLVRNCELDIRLGCPTSQGQLAYCKYWISPGNGTSDYLNACNSGNYSIPTNQWGHQSALSGDAYAHIIVYYPPQGQYREYMQNKLACALQAGKAYEVSFYVSCADDSRYAIDALGAQLSIDPLAQADDKIIDIIGDVHISNTSGQPISSKTDWYRVYGTYIAQGGEEYITIGNFLDNNELNTYEFSSWQTNLASYYVDDISVLSIEPIIELGNDTTICPNDSILFDYSSSCAYGELSWEDGSTDLSRWISEAGYYFLSGSIGCSQFYDAVTVSNSPDPGYFLPLDTVICPNRTVELIPSGTYSFYEWQDGSDQPTYDADTEGQYWLDVINIFGCSFSDTMEVIGLTEPQFSLGNDTLFCLGQEVLLDPGVDSAFHNFLWSDYSTGTTLLAADSGYYWLEVTNPCGAMDDDIMIHTENCSSVIAAPNAFTPNGDGKNDVFTLKGENISNFKMYIYDRWGSLIFESNDITLGWDGAIKGSDAPFGAYVWLAVYDIHHNDNSSETKKMKGTVFLIR